MWESICELFVRFKTLYFSTINLIKESNLIVTNFGYFTFSHQNGLPETAVANVTNLSSGMSNRCGMKRLSVTDRLVNAKNELELNFQVHYYQDCLIEK